MPPYLLSLKVFSKARLPHHGSPVGDAFKYNTPIDIVMEAGGWNSYEMPLRYKGDSAIANEGIKQS